MSLQEAALYGNLILALRDYAAEQLAALDPELEAAAAIIHLDDFIHDWFFTPQEELCGAAPREVIWREQLGEGNPLPKEYVGAFFDNECLICQALREEIERVPADAEHGYFWVYCPDSCLLDRYDPEGSAERWEREFARMGASPA